MENDFWDKRGKTIIQDGHCIIEYIEGVQYVYACKCPICYPGVAIKITKPEPRPMKLLEPMPEDEPEIFDVGHIDDHDKKKYWKSRSKTHSQRKRERKLLRKLSASTENQSSK